MDRTRTVHRASSVLLSKRRTQRRQKLSGAESPRHAPASARSNPDSLSIHDRQLRARCCRISQKKRPTACPERKSNGSNTELKAAIATRNSTADSIAQKPSRISFLESLL